MEHSSEEIEILQLLADLQKVLGIAVNSLGGMTPKNPEAHYIGFVGKGVNIAADGYLILRRAFRVSSSKLLVRPAIELVLDGAAVEHEPGLLVRMAYSEWEEDGRMFNSPASQAQHGQNWEKFEQRVRTFDPSCRIIRKRLSLREAAKFAKMEQHYQVSYRLYCKFTHGALGALSGALDEVTDDSDSRVMSWCVCQALGLLERQTPAKLPDLGVFYERLDRLVFLS
ncbi:MAG: DUF5677 domain-containing protein [Verrucomicrobiota bacterium]|jgi:hypothetical protein